MKTVQELINDLNKVDFVYIVQGGVVDYDYQILGVFSTHEKAEQFREQYIADNKNFIDEVVNNHGNHCILIEKTDLQ